MYDEYTLYIYIIYNFLIILLDICVSYDVQYKNIK